MATEIVAEIIITHPGDPRLARDRWDDIGFESSVPTEGKPTFIVVPLNATAAKIDRVAERFGIPVKTLQAARRAAPPVVPDPQQQVEFFPRRTRAESEEWFSFFERARKIYRVQGKGMAPRFHQNQLVWGVPLDRPLTVDEEIIVHLRTPDWLAPVCLLRQINAVTATQVELVDCYRCDRITIDRTVISSIEISLHAHIQRFNNVSSEPACENGGYRIGCWLSADVPQWIRHQQIEKAFLGPDRSRDPWTPALKAA